MKSPTESRSDLGIEAKTAGLTRLLATSAGVLASVTALVTVPSEAFAQTADDSNSVQERVETARNQVTNGDETNTDRQVTQSDRDGAQAQPEWWWNNWHNWRNWPNWHNWPNWPNWHNW